MEIMNVLDTYNASFGALSTKITKSADGAEFTKSIECAQQSQETREEQYIAHLRSKYGAHFRIESIGRDEESLNKAAGRMSGDDVIIAPNIVSKMAQDPEVAAYYESTIDECFASVPARQASFAAIGLTFEPCGVVVHEDGTVTFICGGGDTPERVAQVNAINAAKNAKRAERARQYFAAAQENARAQRARFSEKAEQVLFQRALFQGISSSESLAADLPSQASSVMASLDMQGIL